MTLQHQQQKDLFSFHVDFSTASAQKKCHYMLLSVLLTFQPSMARPDVAASNGIVLFAFVPVPIISTTTFTLKRRWGMKNI